MKKKTYIVAGTCRRLTRQVLLAIRSFSDANCIVIGGENTRDLRWSNLCSKNWVLNFDRQDRKNDDGLFAALVNYLGEQFPDAVLIPADCEGTRMINRVREKLQVRTIPCADLATLNMMDDKWSFHEFCKKHNLRVPPTIRVGEKSNLDFHALSEAFGLPFIVKPTNQAGSTGVQVIPDEATFNRVIRDNSMYRFDTLIAQKYIDGFDLCFNFFAVNGTISAFSIQRREGKTLRFLPQPQLERLGHALAAASGYSGPMCIDAREDRASGEIFLIESNPRFWGSLAASVWCGLNFVHESLQISPPAGPARRITAGVFHEGHPLLYPPSWKSAIAGRGEHGRVVRAQFRDLPAVAEIVSMLPATVWKRAAKIPGRTASRN